MVIKRILSAILSMAIMFISLTSNVVANENKGMSADNPITISTKAELLEVANDIVISGTQGEGKYYMLTADIDMGGEARDLYFGTFKGDFNGNNHVIKNFTINTKSGVAANGFFRALTGNAKLYNLGLEDVTITTGAYIGIPVGGLVGKVDGNVEIEDTYVKNVTFNATYNPGTAAAYIVGGGMIGRITDATGVVVRNCYALNSATESSLINLDGGLVGQIKRDTASVAHNVTLENCYSNTMLALCENALEASTTITNSYYVKDHWTDTSARKYVGIKKESEDELKTLAEVLGSAYIDDLEALSINEGFPILVWQIDEKFGPGGANILASTIENGQNEVNIFDASTEITFNKYLDTDTLTDDCIVISPSVDYEIEYDDDTYVNKIKLIFDTLSVNTQYTITFNDSIKTFYGDVISNGEFLTFTTITDLPAFEIIDASPNNDETNVSRVNTEMNITFSLPIKPETVIKENISVNPAAMFDISFGESETQIKISFTEELESLTEYTVVFSDRIQSLSEDFMEEKIIKFTTERGFVNLVENGDMENLSNISAFSDANGNANLSFVKENELKGIPNNVLKIAPAWADQPIIIAKPVTEAGTYYMSAWVKSDSEQEVKFIFLTENNQWFTKKRTVEAGEWTYICEEYSIAQGNKISRISINPAKQSSIMVDDWSIYDLSKAPMGDLEILSSSITDGMTNVSPLALVADIEFSVPVKIGTLESGINLSGNEGIEKIIFDPSDFTKCTIVFNTLLSDTEYELDFSGVRSMAGKSVTNDSIKFTTVETSNTEAKVLNTIPADKSKTVKKSTLEIQINFDSPMNPDTAQNISVTPDIGAVCEIKTGDLNKCIITVDENKVVNGQKYTVVIPETVQTLNGLGTQSTSFEFTIISESEICDMYNSACESTDTLKASLNDIYAELGDIISSYEYLTTNMTENIDELCNMLLSLEGASSLNQIKEKISDSSFNIILNNTNDLTTIKNILSKNSGLLSEGTEKVFNDMLTDDYKNKVATYAYSLKNETFSNVREKLVTNVICTAFQCTGGPDAVEEILKLSKYDFDGNNDITSLLEKADSYSTPSKIYKKLQGLEASNLQEIKLALNSAINDFANTENNNSGSGGGFGGGSGGGGGSAVSGLSPIFSVDSTPKDTKDEQKSSFVDIDEVSWAKESIEFLFEKKIIAGKTEDTFAPNDNLTREEFAKIAVLSVGTFDETASADFEDVSINDWSYKYIANAFNMKIINGIGNNLFGKNQLITRQDMAVILARMTRNAGIKTNNENVYFSDYDEISDYAKEDVQFLTSLGIINGVGNNCFDPHGTATRAQAAVIFARWLELIN